MIQPLIAAFLELCWCSTIRSRLPVESLATAEEARRAVATAAGDREEMEPMAARVASLEGMAEPLVVSWAAYAVDKGVKAAGERVEARAPPQSPLKPPRRPARQIACKSPELSP
jgi:ABC-type Fe3+-hydroxamate transport system substrate-binding protein